MCSTKYQYANKTTVYDVYIHICIYMCMVGNLNPFQKDSKGINFTNPGIQLEDVLSPFIQRFYLQCPNLLTLQKSP